MARRVRFLLCFLYYMMSDATLLSAAFLYFVLVLWIVVRPSPYALLTLCATSASSAAIHFRFTSHCGTRTTPSQTSRAPMMSNLSHSFPLLRALSTPSPSHFSFSTTSFVFPTDFTRFVAQVARTHSRANTTPPLAFPPSCPLRPTLFLSCGYTRSPRFCSSATRNAAPTTFHDNARRALCPPLLHRAPTALAQNSFLPKEGPLFSTPFSPSLPPPPQLAFCFPTRLFK
jgi:hypothetical protein